MFTNRILLRQVELGKSIICSGCHELIKLVDKDASTKRKTGDVEDALDELMDTVKRFNNTKITFTI